MDRKENQTRFKSLTHFKTNEEGLTDDIALYRDDIIQNDARSIPLPNNSVDFVFIDSPYSDNVKYSDHPACLGRISCEKEEFFDQLGKIAEEIHRILKPEKVMAWLIGDHWRSKSGFIPVGFKLLKRLLNYFDPVDLVCIARRHQTRLNGMKERENTISIFEASSTFLS